MDDFQRRGFLSSAMAEQRQLAREQFAPAFRECDEASDQAVALIHRTDTRGMSLATLFATCYWFRCVRACQGGVVLAEHGMIPDALTQLRGAVESLFHAVALLNDPGLLERLVEHDMAERLKQAKGVLATPTILQHVSPADRAELEAMVARHVEKPRQFAAYDAARAAGLLALYETMFRGFSRNASHSTISALEHDLAAEADGSITPHFGPSYADLTWTLEMITECLRIGHRHLSGRLT